MLGTRCEDLNDLDLSSWSIWSSCFSDQSGSGLGLSSRSEYSSSPTDELDEEEMGEFENSIFTESERAIVGRLVLIAGGALLHGSIDYISLAFVSIIFLAQIVSRRCIWTYSARG